MFRTRALAVVGIVAAVGSGLVGAGGIAGAAADPSLSDFRLVPTNGELGGRVAALDGELPKLGVQNLLDQANRTPDPCQVPKGPEGFDLVTSRTYCFNDGDDATPDWYPQGITTVADAQDDQQWGTKQAILVSWYSKHDPGRGVRVSFLDPATKRYQHVLLVYPYTNVNGNPSYEAVTTPQSGDGSSVHAGGIVWYGNYLYVADTRRGVRVFDVRYIFDIKSAPNGDVEDSGRVGRHDNKYYSYGYRYVMPQVRGYSHPGGLATHPADNVCNPSGPQKFSHISLDRSTNPDTLITGEYCANRTADRNGRVARYPMDGGSGLPQLTGGFWQATSAYRLPKPNTQGATSHDGWWFLSRTGRGEDGAGHLTTATQPTGATGTLGEMSDFNAAVGVEDLSYWPGSKELFTVTEFPNKRVIYSVKSPPGT